LRGFGSCERQFRRREQTGPNPCRPHREVPEPQGAASRGAPSARQLGARSAHRGHPQKPLRSVEDQRPNSRRRRDAGEDRRTKVARLTKQERVLTLLSQPRGPASQK
jgi:hypothetical protein